MESEELLVVEKVALALKAASCLWCYKLPLAGPATQTGGAAMCQPTMSMIAVASILLGDETLQWDLLGSTFGTQAICLASAEETQRPPFEHYSIHRFPNVHDAIGSSLLHIFYTPIADSTHVV